MDAHGLRADQLRRRALAAGPHAEDGCASRQAHARPQRTGVGRGASARADVDPDFTQSHRRDGGDRPTHRRGRRARVTGSAHAGGRAARLHRAQLRPDPELRLFPREVRAVRHDRQRGRAGDAQPSRGRGAFRATLGPAAQARRRPRERLPRQARERYGRLLRSVEDAHGGAGDQRAVLLQRRGAPALRRHDLRRLAHRRAQSRRGEEGHALHPDHARRLGPSLRHLQPHRGSSTCRPRSSTTPSARC